MSDSKELGFLEKILLLLEQGFSEVDIVDQVGDDLFEYLNILESYYIHAGRYGEDIIVAKAKDEVDVDPELVKEILEDITTRDEKVLIVYLKDKIRRYQ